MKRLSCLLVAFACSSQPRAVEIAAPLVRAQPAVVAVDVAVPDGAVRVDAAANGEWAAAFPAAKTFAKYDVRAPRVILTWTVGAEHIRKDLVGGNEDYPVNHVSPLSLEARAQGLTQTIQLGEIVGGINAHMASWCFHRGFRNASPEYDWKPPAAAVVSMFDMGITQGDDQFMVVRDGAKLHVLHRDTSDGKCDDEKQGPLDVCEGFEWSRVAEIAITESTVLYENVLDAGKIFDCTSEHWGSSLIKP